MVDLLDFPAGRVYTSLMELVNFVCSSINAVGFSALCRPLKGGAFEPTNHPRAVCCSARTFLSDQVGKLMPVDVPSDIGTALRDVLDSASTHRLDREATVQPFDESKLRILKSNIQPVPLLPMLSPAARRYAMDPARETYGLAGIRVA